MFSAEAALELENKINEFPYVVAEFKKPEIAFGSGTERFTRKSTLDKKRRARVKFIIREQLEIPAYKYGLLHNYPSNRGYTAMANRSPRFKLPPESKYPAPNAYDYVRPETAAKISYPFNTSDARSRLPSGKPIGPSPCDYYLYRRRIQQVEMGFGKQRYVIPGYAVFCGSENKSRCFKCQTQPVGDYYHNFDVHLDLCRPCMNAELAELNNCKYNRLKRSSRLRELGKFKPARWCHFYHKHYYGNLAVNKFPLTTLRLKNRVENYLQSYDTLLKWGDDSPAVGQYLTEGGKPIKQCKKPFNVGAALRKEPTFLTPAPTTYPYHIKVPDRLKYCLAFGTRRVIWPATPVFCSARNFMKCFRCQEQPEGDYYHNFKLQLDICRRCLNKEVKELRHCKTDDYKRKLTLREWSEFKLVRHCSFYHLHKSGNMKSTLMTKSDLRKKINMENYLYQYYPVWDKRYV